VLRKDTSENFKHIPIFPQVGDTNLPYWQQLGLRDEIWSSLRQFAFFYCSNKPKASREAADEASDKLIDIVWKHIREVETICSSALHF
jgi:hypothetical protein